MPKETTTTACRTAPTICILALLASLGGCEPADSVRTLGVNVRGSVSVLPTTFSGHFVYEDRDGREVRRNLDGRGNVNVVVQGRQIKLVTLRRTSATGVIGLVLTSDGDIVYDSGMLQTNDLIFYEAR